MTALLLACTVACADDITLTDGTVFKDARLISHTDKSVTLTFADGVAEVDIRKVPPILVKAMDAVPTPAPVPVPMPKFDSKIQSLVNHSGVSVSGIVTQILAKGIIANLSASYTHMVTVPHSESSTVDTVPGGLGHTPVLQTTTRTWTTTEPKTDLAYIGPAFVVCDSHNLEEGQSWKGDIWFTGTYTYTDDDGSPHAMLKCTSDQAVAYTYYSTHPDQLSRLTPRSLQNSDTPAATSPVNTNTSISIPPMNGR